MHVVACQEKIYPVAQAFLPVVILIAQVAQAFLPVMILIA